MDDLGVPHFSKLKCSSLFLDASPIQATPLEPLGCGQVVVTRPAIISDTKSLDALTWSQNNVKPRLINSSLLIFIN